MPKPRKKKIYVGKAKRKTTAKHYRKRPNVRANRSGRKRVPEKRRVSKTSKASTSKKPIRHSKGKGSKRVQRREKGTVEISRPKSRKQQKVHFDFKHVRSVDKKIDLIDKVGDKVLKQQFKRKGGEPPMGMVVTVTDRHGRSASDIAPSDLVINRKNTKEFIGRFLRSLKNNNNRFRERNANRPKGKGLERGTGYDDFNPDNVVTVTVKFIYAKEE